MEFGHGMEAQCDLTTVMVKTQLHITGCLKQCPCCTQEHNNKLQHLCFNSHIPAEPTFVTSCFFFHFSKRKPLGISGKGFLQTGYPSSNCIKTIKALAHTHPFNGPFSGTTQVSRYQKGRTNLDFTEARDK